MAASTLPLEIEQVVYAGTDLLREYRWLPDGTNPPPSFDTWTAAFLVGPQRGAAVISHNTIDGGITLGADGLITLRLTAAETRTLAGNSLSYIVDLTAPDGFVERFMRGRITLVRDVEP